MDEDLLGGAWEIAVAADWLDTAAVAYWLVQGKVAVWFDYLALVKCGLSGAELEQELASHGVGVYGKLVVAGDDGLAGFVQVDAGKVQVARWILSEWGILL